jgi:hypothetical protein
MFRSTPEDVDRKMSLGQIISMKFYPCSIEVRQSCVDRTGCRVSNGCRSKRQQSSIHECPGCQTCWFLVSIMLWIERPQNIDHVSDSLIDTLLNGIHSAIDRMTPLGPINTGRDCALLVCRFINSATEAKHTACLINQLHSSINSKRVGVNKTPRSIKHSSGANRHKGVTFERLNRQHPTSIERLRHSRSTPVYN